MPDGVSLEGESTEGNRGKSLDRCIKWLKCQVKLSSRRSMLICDLSFSLLGLVISLLLGRLSCWLNTVMC